MSPQPPWCHPQPMELAGPLPSSAGLEYEAGNTVTVVKGTQLNCTIT